MAAAGKMLTKGSTQTHLLSIGTIMWGTGISWNKAGLWQQIVVMAQEALTMHQEVQHLRQEIAEIPLQHQEVVVQQLIRE